MVAIEDDSDSSDLDLGVLAGWAEVVLAAEGYPETAELSVILVNDQEMATLNASALGGEGPTDVLSFPIDDLVPGQVPVSDGPPIVIGDVFLAPAYIRKQARSLGLGETDEFALMVTHGILHCLGYKHEIDGDAKVMEAREREILASLGLRRR
jgi:probable rRNA maturation factor